MDVPFATDFNDYVAVMSANSPHALVMDWWRRLELTLREYAAALGQVVRSRDRRPIEKAVSLNDAALTACIRGLRLRRNQVAHESCYLSSEDAAAYAQEASSVIAALATPVINEIVGERQDDLPCSECGQYGDTLVVRTGRYTSRDICHSCSVILGIKW